MRIKKSACLIFILLFMAFSRAFAEEITLLFTGQTHSMLYQCSCPVEPDGGVARRATLIKQLRAKNNRVILLDGGNFFAGGPKDQYTQNTQLDLQRTQVNFKAMELMKYDCAAVGEEEFNFGRKTFEETASVSKVPFVSSNLESKDVRPYIMKNVGGIAVGITAVSPLSAAGKADGLKFEEPVAALKKAVGQMKEKGANVIIVLSNVSANENLSFVKEVKGIDIVIEQQPRNENVLNRIDSAVFLRPSWQGRKLVKTVISIKGKKIEDVTAEEIRISDRLADDKEIKTILPACFADSECKKELMSAKCQNPGEKTAACIFTPANKVDLTIVLPQECKTCNTEGIVKFLKKQLPGLVVSNVYYPGPKAQDLIKKFGMETLPLYILSKDLEKEKSFNDLKDNLELINGFYRVRPEVAGIAFFMNRTKEKERFDVFISMFDKNTPSLLENSEEFKPIIHFLLIEQEGGFAAAGGPAEAEEAMRSVCVKKYQPGFYWNYLKCRAANIYSTWWDNCISGADLERIRACAKGDEGVGLLKENIQLNKDLKIMAGPAYLIDNQEIFSSVKAPTKEEFRKIITGK